MPSQRLQPVGSSVITHLSRVSHTSSKGGGGASAAAREMAHKGALASQSMSSDPQNPCDKAGRMSRTCNPSPVRGGDEGNPWPQAAHQPGCVEELRAREALPQREGERHTAGTGGNKRFMIYLFETQVIFSPLHLQRSSSCAGAALASRTREPSEQWKQL